MKERKKENLCKKDQPSSLTSDVKNNDSFDFY